MNIDEFRKRVGAFMSEDEIARYDSDFEPAYMESSCVTKDEFCKTLRDENARHIIRAMCHALSSRNAVEDILRKERNAATDAAQRAEGRADELMHRIEQIQSICDRSKKDKPSS